MKIGKERKGERRKPINMLFMRNKFKTISWKWKKMKKTNPREGSEINTKQILKHGQNLIRPQLF